MIVLQNPTRGGFRKKIEKLGIHKWASCKISTQLNVIEEIELGIFCISFHICQNSPIAVYPTRGSWVLCKPLDTPLATGLGTFVKFAYCECRCFVGFCNVTVNRWSYCSSELTYCSCIEPWSCDNMWLCLAVTVYWQVPICDCTVCEVHCSCETRLC